MSRIAKLLAAGVLGGGGQTYSQKIQALFGSSMIGWWKMAEPSGSVSLDSSGQGNNGAYTAVTLAQPGIGDGSTAASFDGSTSLNNIYSAALNADFNGAEGSLALFLKVADAGVWTDGISRFPFTLYSGAANYIVFQRTTVNGQFSAQYIAGSTTSLVTVGSLSTVNWMAWVITWNKAQDRVLVYLNGVQQGTTQTGLGTWSGNLLSTRTAIGAFTTTPTFVWSGLLANGLLLNREMTAAEVAVYSNPF